MTEAVVPLASRIVGRSAMDIGLLRRKGVMLVGLSREGKRTHRRVRKTPIRPGDVLLLLGPEERLADVVGWLGCLSLADRGLEVTQNSKAWPSVGVFALAIVAASVGWVSLPIALGAVVVLYVLLEIVPLNQLYEAVEWPVIVLLGSMIPLSVAMEATGGTALIAEQVVNLTEGLPTVAVLTLLMVVTMTLSDMLNNVATALIAAPIGLLSGYFGGRLDTVLMRFSDVFLAFPPLLLPIAITAAIDIQSTNNNAISRTSISITAVNH